jgi:predicted nuclease of predicted toxin-antitoxin system
VKLLIDENLSPGLAEIARQRGLHSRHVNEIGLNGAGDPVLMKRILDEDWVLVTNNGQEFLARYAARAPLHAGLVILVAANGRQEQEAAFKAVLIYLQQHHPDPLNMALIVEREATDLVIRAVEWPMRSD